MLGAVGNINMSILDMKKLALGDYMGCVPNVETDTLEAASR